MMTMSDSKNIDSENSENLGSNTETDYRQLAIMIVDNLLSKAVSKASEHLFHGKDIESQNRPQFLSLLTPAIQIDLVGTRTPSPEEDYVDWSVSRKQYRFKSPADQQSISGETDFSINDFELSEGTERDIHSMYSNTNIELSHKDSLNDFDIEECKQLAKQLIETIISTAIEKIESNPAIETSKIRTSRSDNQCFETNTWMTRIRQIFGRLMRSSCFCKSKEQFRQRKS